MSAKPKQVWNVDYKIWDADADTALGIDTVQMAACSEYEARSRVRLWAIDNDPRWDSQKDCVVVITRAVLADETAKFKKKKPRPGPAMELIEQLLPGRPSCLRCDGDCEVCTNCGETERNCICEDNHQWFEAMDCPACGGTGDQPPRDNPQGVTTLPGFIEVEKTVSSTGKSQTVSIAIDHIIMVEPGDPNMPDRYSKARCYIELSGSKVISVTQPYEHIMQTLWDATEPED